ncbi:Lrp/AsnC family transcriptional regulator [Simiduia sp. 21SJ11W-1]|uniref:Lrp/AsnC family transcriptional regulator n=1 Tax=Simiduia sp. 21SJ11W-1 TaxID=2909669 RepID=UPI0020A21BA3|nr:Lrp/AsnC family transcriptional regulator [Simiduia sp. 21SJ11W-1]UTA49329.1 Lrp/AsnC family transcriptional regulator [Simiduia sp. 21SJ11W-1]
MKFSDSERQILRLLQQNGRASNVELAQKVGLSESPCFRRVKQLEEAGVISGYAAIVDQRKLGLDVTAFVQVTLDQRLEQDTEAFLEAVAAEGHIMECYATSGDYDFLLRVVARNIDDFADISMRRILKFPGVKNIVSTFSLQTIKNSQVLPT